MARRILKGIGIAFGALLALLVALAAFAWWWAGTPGSVDWVLRQVAKSQSLTAEGVRGSLREGLQAGKLRWEKDGLAVEAIDADLAWQPLALVRATLKLDHLRAKQLRFDDRRPPQPKSLPVSLALPLRVEVGELQVGRAEWHAAGNDFVASDIAGSYTYDTVSHHVQLRSLQWAGGRYSGEATLGAHGRMPVAARLQGTFATDVPGTAARKLPLAFSAQLQGPVTRMEVRAQVQSPDPTVAAQATATALLTPWEAQPLPQAQARFRAFDAAALWPQAPHTALSGEASVQPAGTTTWVIHADVTNAQAGPWDSGKLPVERLRADGEWRGGAQAIVRDLQARVGGGEVTARGEWQGKTGWSIDAQLAGVDPAALHGAMASLPVGGTAHAKGRDDGIAFDVALKSQGRAASREVAAIELRSVTAEGRWNDGVLDLPQLDVQMADAALRASVRLRPQSKSGSGRATLAGPGLLARAEGEITQDQGGGTLRVASSDLPQALRWISKFPGVPAAVSGTPLASGRGEVQLAWQGGWRDPSIDANASVASLALGGPQPAWSVREGTLRVQGRLADAQVQARARAEQGQRRVALEASGRAGHGTDAWQGRVDALQVTASDPGLGTGTWTLSLRRPVTWRHAPAATEAGAGEALLKSPRDADQPAVLAWDPVRWQKGELQTSGRITGLPLAWLDLLGGPQLAGSAVSGDMVFDANWDAQLGDVPRIRAALVRSRGDLTLLAEGADGQAARVKAGVREARIAVTSEGDSVSATLRWDSERGGSAEGRVSTRLARSAGGGWEWPAAAPLSGHVRAQLPRIGVWSVLAPPGWRLRGSLQADLGIAGTRADPQVNGTLSAEDLALRSVVDGIELQGGRLRARFDGQRVVVDEFLLHGAGTAGGSLRASGEGRWTASGPAVRLAAQVERLRASIRSDRQLTVSGQLTAQRDAAGTDISGKLRVDQALIELPEESAPKLGDDVLVRNAAGPVTTAEVRATQRAADGKQPPMRIAVDVDLGTDFHVRGMGVDTRLRGELTVGGQSVTAPRITGTIRTAGGEYRAYGQRLDIERGVIRFTGAPDNPSLDILAIRPRLVQRVGVLVTGNALAPYVRLYSEPDLPDAEKLAWLVTGRAAPATGAESALVQQAALALLASRSGANKRSIASTLGLDELSFRREGANGPSVTLGKRFGRNFYAAYERSLSGALGTVYIFYDITQKVTFRAQAGERTALDLIYTFAFN